MVSGTDSHSYNSHVVDVFSSSQKSGLFGAVQFTLLVGSWAGLLFAVSYYLTGSWDFVQEVHGVM